MKQITILFSVLFLVMLGFGIIIPVLPYYAEYFGASEDTFGWLMATYSIMQFIFAPIWGKLSDKVGRKPILLIGLSGYIASFILFAFASKLWVLFVARVLAGILSSATLPTAMAIVADQTTEEQRGKAMGMLGAGIGLGFIFGPAIGGVLSNIQWLNLPSLATPFLFTAILATIPFTLAFFKLEESLSVEEKLRNEESGRSRKISFQINADNLALVYLSAFIVSFTLAGLEGTFAFFAKDRAGITTQELGYIFMIMGVANAFVQGGLIGKLINKYGEESTIKFGLLVSSLGFFLLIFANQFWSLAFFLAIFGMGNGMMRPSISSLISKRTTKGQGTAIGIMDSMDSLGRIAGPPIAGILYISMMEFPYLLGAIFTVVFAGLFHIKYRTNVVKTKEAHNH